jgi:SET domain-containing protein
MPRLYAVKRSSIHGNGVFATRALPEGRTVMRYRGRLLTHAQTNRLFAGGVESGHTFLFTLNEQYVLDGDVPGNSARWANHSCEPNCRAVLVEHGRDPRKDEIHIETLRPIKAGEELTFDYGITLDVRHTARLKALWACRCGAASCSGTLLRPKKRSR